MDWGGARHTTQIIIFVLAFIHAAQLERVELSNSCSDYNYRGSVITSRSWFRVLFHRNWTTTAKELHIGLSKMSSTSIVHVSSLDWHGGTRISLDVNKSQAVPPDMAMCIRKKDQRYRVRVRALLNGMVASDWSPEYVLQTCLGMYMYIQVIYFIKPHPS